MLNRNQLVVYFKQSSNLERVLFSFSQVGNNVVLLQLLHFKVIHFNIVQFWPSAYPLVFKRFVSFFSLENHHLKDLFNASIAHVLRRKGQQYSRTSSKWHPSIQHSCTISVDELSLWNRRRKVLAFFSSSSTDPTQTTKM